MGDIYYKANNDDFNKVMTRKQVMRKDTTINHSTPQSQKRSVFADNKE